MFSSDCLVRVLAFTETGKVLKCTDCPMKTDECPVVKEDISNKRCGSCIYCKNIYEDSKYKACVRTSSVRCGRVVSAYDRCCSQYVPKYRKIPK